MQTTTIETKKRYQCRHIFTDGRRCGSACLRGEELCYYHRTTRKPIADPQQRRGRRSTFDLPLPEDRSAIQQSIGEVLRRIASNNIDPRRAGLLLYGLQIASLNLPKPATHHNAKSEPAEIVEEITAHPELGVLAPRAEVGKATQRKSAVALLIERMMQSEQESVTPEPQFEPRPEPATIPNIQAVAALAAPAIQSAQLSLVGRKMRRLPNNNAEVFRLLPNRHVPPARRNNALLNLLRSPRMRLIRIHRSLSLQHRTNDAPRLFHIVLSRKQRRIPSHGIGQHPLIRLHLSRTRMPARNHLHRLTLALPDRRRGRHPHRHRHLRAHPEPHIVLLHLALDHVRHRWLAQTAHHFHAGHRKILSRPDVKRHPVPPPRLDL